MSPALGVGIAALLPVAGGYALWRRLANPSRLECVGFALPVAVVLVAGEMLAWSWFGRAHTLATLLVPLAGLGLACAFVPQASSLPQRPADERGRAGLAGLVALALIATESCLVLWEVATHPGLVDWDAWAIWGMKAKAFFVDGDVTPYLARAAQYDFSWPARPCLTSLYQAFLYHCAGRVHEPLARLGHVALCASLALIFYSDVRRRFTADRALVWTAVLVTIPNVTYQCSAGVANLVLGLYLFAALSALDTWSATSGLRALAGPALLLAGALLARDEGLVLVLLVMGAFLAVSRAGSRPDWGRAILACLVLMCTSGATYGLWSGLVRTHGIWDIRSTWSRMEAATLIWEHRHQIPAILQAVGAELVSPDAQTRASPLEEALGIALLWPLFAVACVALATRRGSDSMGLRCAFVAVGGLLMYTLGFIAFPYQDLDDLRNNWLRVLDRHALALAPLALRAMASAFGAASVRPGEVADGAAKLAN